MRWERNVFQDKKKKGEVQRKVCGKLISGGHIVKYCFMNDFWT